MLQVRTFAEEVYNQFVRGDQAAVPRVTAAALPAVVVLAALTLIVVRRWDRHLPPLNTLLTPPRTFPLGRLRWPCFGLILGIVAVFSLIPIASLLYKAGSAGSPESWTLRMVLGSLTKAAQVRSGMVASSLFLAVVTGAFAATLGVVACWLALEARWFRFSLLALMAIAWAMPGPVLGIALKDVIDLVRDAVPLPFVAQALYYGPSPVPAGWAYLLRFFPAALAVLWPVVRLLPTELRDLARVDGLTPRQEFRYVVWPLTWPAVCRAALAVAVLSLGELGASKLVEPPGSVTFAHELFSQMHTGTTNDVAALCLLLLGMTLVGGALVAAALSFPNNSLKNRAQ
jgi:ABC-type Fe3+ transport system permease subunit